MRVAATGIVLGVSAASAWGQCSPSVLDVRMFASNAAPYVVNGQIVPGVPNRGIPLTFVEGQSYTFNFPTGGFPVPSIHPFILTTDPDGGAANAGTGQISVVQLPGYTFGSHCATACGAAGGNTFTCTPGPLTPSLFYYQCSTHLNLGASITILRLPVISDQPDNTRVCLSNEVTLTVVAAVSEGTLTYQWRKGVTNLVGEVGPSLTVLVDTSAKLGLYNVVVSNQCASVTSNSANLWTCFADLSDNQGNPVCDGGVDINDLLYFLEKFEQGDVAVDLDNGTSTGTSDGGVDISDLLFFLAKFEGGC